MARFKPHEPSSRLALAAFLRGYRTKQHEEPPVDAEAAVRRLDTGLCYRCGELIEQALFRLGSPRCHDCRDSAVHDLRPD